jgi:hypothetical protein
VLIDSETPAVKFLVSSGLLDQIGEELPVNQHAHLPPESRGGVLPLGSMVERIAGHHDHP